MAAHRAPGREPQWARTGGVVGVGAALALVASLLAGPPQDGQEPDVLAAAGLGGPVGAATSSLVASPAVQETPRPSGPVCQNPGVLPGDFLLHTGSVGAGALGATALGCAADVLDALPRTELERTEPELLYSLITRESPIEPLRYAPEDLVTVQGGPYQLRAEAAAQLEELIAEAEEQGHPWLVVSSGYRDYDTQAGTHQDWVNRVGAQRASVVSAVAGHSEHQLGLAVDVGGECGLYDCFGRSEDGRWVAENAHRWGFIIRYPEGGEEVTGYAYEPWHLRYVGPRAAWHMHLTGEVYWEDVQPTLLATD